MQSKSLNITNSLKKILSFSLYFEITLLVRQLLLCISPGKQSQRKPKKTFQGFPGNINPNQQNMKRAFLTLTGVAIEDMKTLAFLEEGLRLLGPSVITIPGMAETSINQSINGSDTKESDTIPPSGSPWNSPLHWTQCSHLGLTSYNKCFSFYGYKYLSQT